MNQIINWEGKTPNWTAKQAAEFLRQYGYFIKDKHGSHIQMVNLNHASKITIPWHSSGNINLKKNIVLSILRQSAAVRNMVARVASEEEIKQTIPQPTPAPIEPVAKPVVEEKVEIMSEPTPQLTQENIKEFLKEVCSSPEKWVRTKEVAAHFDSNVWNATYHLNALRKRGITCMPKKGYWTLTHSGMIAVGLTPSTPAPAAAPHRILPWPVDNSNKDTIVEQLKNEIQLWQDRYIKLAELMAGARLLDK